MRLERAEVAALYERYLARCNEHRFDELGEFVSKQVSGGSGAADGLACYIARLKTVHSAFPHYRWDVEEIVVEQATLLSRQNEHKLHPSLPRS